MPEPHPQQHQPAADNGNPDSLLDLVVEELMRCCDDPTWIETALDTPDNQREAFIGRWLGTHPQLTPGTPLAAWAGLSPLDDNWRSHIPAAPGSLWYQVEQDRTANTGGLYVYRQWRDRHCH